MRLEGDSIDLRRSRVTVFFRLPLLIPHLVWLGLWGILAFLAVILQWFVTLFAGRPATVFHRFLSRYVRYAFHVYAFGSLAANPFPGFTGKPGVYPLDLVLPEPDRQNRWKTLFRGILVVPALIVTVGLWGVVVLAAILTWFAALARRRPRRASATSLRGRCATSARRTRTSTSSPTSTRTRARSKGAESEPAPMPAVEPELVPVA